MKLFKLVWLQTRECEIELDSIKNLNDVDSFIESIQCITGSATSDTKLSVTSSVNGAYKIFKWDGKEYVPYLHKGRHYI